MHSANMNLLGTWSLCSLYSKYHHVNDFHLIRAWHLKRL